MSLPRLSTPSGETLAADQAAAKALLRRRLLAARRDFVGPAREAAVRRIHEELLRSELLLGARVVLGYWSTESEVATPALLHALLSRGTAILLPRLTDEPGVFAAAPWTGEECLELGPYNLYQPKAVPTPTMPPPDVVLVPGVAFDPAGGRLGHGKGYYDRYLSRLDTPATTVGLAFDVQVVPHVPTEPHDVPLHYLVTESGLRACHAPPGGD